MEVKERFFLDMFTENVAFDYVAWQIFAFLKENNVFHQVYIFNCI